MTEGRETLGSLSSADLGRTISVTDGGSTHTGSLKQVQHDTTLSGDPQTLVVLVHDEWRHVKTYPSNTTIGGVE